MNNTYFKSLFLLFGLLFVISCQEDDLNENVANETSQTPELFISYNNMDEILKNEKALHRPIAKIQDKSKDLTSSLYNFSFDETKVQVMQGPGYTQYTFLVKRDNANDLVENYICRVFDNDSIDQFLTSYPVIKTQDSLEIAYTSGRFQIIQDDAIDVSKMPETCVPVFVEQETEITIPCTSDDHHQDESECDCGNMDTCEPPSTTTITTTVFTLECENVGGGDDGDGYDGSDNNNPDGPTQGGGSGGTDPIDVPDNVLTDPVEPEVLLKQPVRDFIENLDDTKKECYDNGELNDMGTGTGSGLNSMIDDIDSFLNQNTVNGVLDPEAAAFVEAILEDCDSDQEVDLEERIIDDGLIGKEKCLHDQLNDLDNNFIQDLLSNFTGESSEFGIRIKSKDHVYRTDSDGNSVEVSGITNYQSNESIIEININSTEASNNQALHVLRTILHEYIHAEIIRRININPNGDFTNVYNSYKNNGFQPTAAHQTMAELYVESMKNVIKDFHKEMMGPDYDYLSNGGSTALDDFYEALAWKGLEQHGVQAWIDLPQNRKDELHQAYQQHIFSTTHSCIND